RGGKKTNGVPEGIRTPDRRLRRPLLYPAELLGRDFKAVIGAGFGFSSSASCACSSTRPCPMRTLMSIHGAFSDVLYPAELLGRDFKAVIGTGFSFSSSASCACSSTKLCPMRTLMSIHDVFRTCSIQLSYWD